MKVKGRPAGMFSSGYEQDSIRLDAHTKVSMLDLDSR